MWGSSFHHHQYDPTAPIPVRERYIDVETKGLWNVITSSSPSIDSIVTLKDVKVRRAWYGEPDVYKISEYPKDGIKDSSLPLQYFPHPTIRRSLKKFLHSTVHKPSMTNPICFPTSGHLAHLSPAEDQRESI